jgi:two-component system OmpR family response regulator
VYASAAVASILIVDDDPHIREVVRYALESAGHAVDAAEDGRAGLVAARSRAPELIVLDILMPGLDGIEVCRELRKTSSVPILFLSSKDDEIDRVIGLEVGGDDYVTKPFSPRELVARVKAMLRRVQMAREPSPAPSPERPVRRHGGLELDPERFEVRWGGRAVVLTVTEFGVVETLMSAPGKVFTRAELVERAYSFDNHVTERTIDSHVRRVRKKFDADGEPVETVFGLGYRLGTCKPS